MAKRAVRDDLDDDYGVHRKLHKVDDTNAPADDVNERWQQRYHNSSYFELFRNAMTVTNGVM